MFFDPMAMVSLCMAPSMNILSTEKRLENGWVFFFCNFQQVNKPGSLQQVPGEQQACSRRKKCVCNRSTGYEAVVGKCTRLRQACSRCTRYNAGYSGCMKYTGCVHAACMQELYTVSSRGVVGCIEHISRGHS